MLWVNVAPSKVWSLADYLPDTQSDHGGFVARESSDLAVRCPGLVQPDSDQLAGWKDPIALQWPQARSSLYPTKEQMDWERTEEHSYPILCLANLAR